MLVSSLQPQFDLEPCTFPWAKSTKDPRGQYVNFISHPHLIEATLEDFQPFSKTNFAKSFYKLLRWINGPDSVFESTGCALATKQTHPQHLDTIWSTGWLALILRDHPLNLNRDLITTIKELINCHANLSPGKRPYASLAIAEHLTEFIELSDLYTAIKEPPVGWTIVLHWFILNSSKPEAMSTLNVVFNQLPGVLAEVSSMLTSFDRTRIIPNQAILRNTRHLNAQQLTELAAQHHADVYLQ